MGVGFSCKMRKTDKVVVCFFGDGAFHEAMNAAAIWNLPLIFACENNLYGASKHINQIFYIKDLAERGVAYGIPAEVVDGNDVLKVNEAVTNLKKLSTRTKNYFEGSDRKDSTKSDRRHRACQGICESQSGCKT